MNIAEHIAYLIGDSKRVVIPIYPNTSPPPPPIPDDNTNNGNGNGNMNMASNTGCPHGNTSFNHLGQLV